MKQKKILITGSNGKIGNELCKKFKDSGWFVVGIDQHETCNSNTDHYEKFDFSNGFSFEENPSIEKLNHNILNDELDCLINNAGIQITKSFNQLSYENIINTYNVNIFAPIFLVKWFLNSLIKTGGSVINISSIHSHLTKKNFLAYSTSKAALDNFTKSLVLEFGSRIRVNGISPAAIDTPMLREGFGNNKLKINNLRNFHPSNTLGTVKSVSSVAYFLATTEDLFLNGSIIDLSGGISSKLHDPE